MVIHKYRIIELSGYVCCKYNMLWWEAKVGYAISRSGQVLILITCALQGSAVAMSTLYPLDTVRTRLQCECLTTAVASKYCGGFSV